MKARIDPGIRFADIVHAARIGNASDLHLAAGRQAVARVNGMLTPLSETRFDADELWSVVVGLMSDANRAEFERIGDVSMSFDFADGGRARMHVLRTGGEPVLAVRLLDREPPALEQLNLPSVVGSLGRRERGLVVLAGPTGCGKSTTLAAIVGDMNRDYPRRIVTLEDPINTAITTVARLFRSVRSDLTRRPYSKHSSVRSARIPMCWWSEKCAMRSRCIPC